MALEKKERRRKIVDEWRRLIGTGPAGSGGTIRRAVADLLDAKATGLAVKAEVEASIAAGDGLYDQSDVDDLQALVDLYVSEVAKL